MYHMFHHGCWWWKAVWRRDAVIWCYMNIYEYQEFEVLPSDVNIANSIVIFGRLWGNFEYLYADQPARASNSTNQGVGYIGILMDIDGYWWNGEARGFHRFPEFPGSGSYLSSLAKASLSLANRLHLGRFPTCEGQNGWQLVIFTGFQKWSYPKMEGLIMV